MTTIQGTELAPPRFEDRDGFTVAGLCGHLTPATATEIPAIWQQFGPHIGLVPHEVSGTAYGVCCRFGENNAFDYIAGVEVSATSGLPDDFDSIEMKPQYYAVFHHSGHITDIQRVFTAIWQQFLPDTRIPSAAVPLFETYGPEFDAATGNGGFSIWIPLMIEPNSEWSHSRVFEAPKELVYRMWTEPEHMAAWWGPKTFTTPVCELDAQPGGKYRLTMRSPEGDDHPIKGTYIETVPGEKLVMTVDCSEQPQAWHDLVRPWHPQGTDPGLEAIQTVTFEDEGGKTKMTIRMRFTTAQLRDSHVNLGMALGWGESIDKLEALLAAAK